MPLLFSYGTLQHAPVQLSTFGGLLVGYTDELVRFEQSLFKIDDPAFVATSGKAYHAIVSRQRHQSFAPRGSLRAKLANVSTTTAFVGLGSTVARSRRLVESSDERSMRTPGTTDVAQRRLQAKRIEHRMEEADRIPPAR